VFPGTWEVHEPEVLPLWWILIARWGKEGEGLAFHHAMARPDCFAWGSAAMARRPVRLKGSREVYIGLVELDRRDRHVLKMTWILMLIFLYEG
jgi:hypothetical protein